MTINVIYIDDVSQELLRYRNRFTTDVRTKENINITTIDPPRNPEDYIEISEASPDLFLVDYNLDKPDENNLVIGISGVSLSTELRRRYPEIPIALFTRKSVFRLQSYTGIKDTLSSIDEIIYKQEVFKEGSTIIEEMNRLAAGYRELRNLQSRGWNDLVKLLGASQGDSMLLEQANPPIIHRQRWTASSVASWIRDTILNYPGILYDPVYTATLLGISKQTFLSHDFQATFAPAKYEGIFAPIEGRWWRAKVQTIATSMMTKKEKELPLRHGFPVAWERRNAIIIDRAKCIYSDQTPADWVCYILKEPVMIKFSLSYSPDNRPSIMDEARVSYKAVKTSNEFNEKLVDSLGRELIPDIRRTPNPEV